jgi:hypothetical protein
MTNSSYAWQDRFEGRAMGHDAIGMPRGPPRGSERRGELHTTAQDYARFLAAILGRHGTGRRFAAQMIHPQTK